MYFCQVYNQEDGHNVNVHPIQCNTYREAKKIAVERATLVSHGPKSPCWYIFKIPFTLHHYVTISLDDCVIETVYDPETVAAMKIQKWWHAIYINRLISAFVIRKHVHRALANPGTQLGRDRLLREFRRM